MDYRIDDKQTTTNTITSNMTGKISCIEIVDIESIGLTLQSCQLFVDIVLVRSFFLCLFDSFDASVFLLIDGIEL
jgi:hypothetical protein